MKKICLLFTLLIIIMFLSGCWDYREIEDVSIANVIAIDIDEQTKEYILNVVIVDVENQGTGGSLKPIVIETKGRTIVDAVRNVISITTKAPYWSHVSIIVLSQEVAREGIIPILDWVSRSPELNLRVRIFISMENTAQEILQREKGFTEIRTFEYETIKKSFRYLSKLPDIKLNKLINEVEIKELNPVLPVIGLVDLHGESAVQYIGSAYFKNDKLSGFLDPIDTIKYLFVTNEVEGGVIVVPLDEGNVTLDIYRNNTDTNIDFIDDSIKITINIKPTVNIAEIDSSTDFTSQNGRMILKEKADNYLKNEIESFIKAIQENPGIDIFRFGNKLMRNHPRIWNTIEDNWDEIFKELIIEVNSDIKIKGSQHTSAPIGVEKND
ncbi:MAG: Ger(x)C family spore germination protein [Tissierellaceae bacterium]|nr:Ger(x)C family spore germination protein [Tissierellaceae bacterium]